MRKIAFLITLLAFSCSDIHEEDFSYSFVENASLSIEPFGGGNGYMNDGVVGEGTNLVFEYRHYIDYEKNTVDDEITEYVRFEIDPELTEFDFENEELEDIKAVFTKSCFCSFPEDVTKEVPPTGTISGEKISEMEWSVTIDATFYGDEERLVSGIFRRKD